MFFIRYLIIVLLLSLSAVPAATAGPSETIIGKNAVFCDDQDRVCLRGTLTYHANPRLLDLRSRVQRAVGPGLLKIRLVGENADGHTRRTTIEVRIRGDYSEIVNSRVITDHPDVYSWELDSISFEPGRQGASGQERREHLGEAISVAPPLGRDAGNDMLHVEPPWKR